jgi:hypothetical protein
MNQTRFHFCLSPSSRIVSGWGKSRIDVCKKLSAKRAFPTAIRHRPKAIHNAKKKCKKRKTRSEKNKTHGSNEEK